MPKVSILLTCYNHFQFLPQAVESIRSQTFKDYEILALDDGSTDGSREWIAKQPDLVPVFQEANLGTYGNLNVGLDLAQGDYIAELNDDDYWDTSKLEKQVATLEQDPRIGLVHTSGAFVDPNGAQLQGAPLGYEFPTSSDGQILHELVCKNRIIASSVMFRRSLVAEVGQFDPHFWGCGDWHMWLRIAEVAHITRLPGELTFYRVHPGMASHEVGKMSDDSRRIREWLSTKWPEYERRFGRTSQLRAAQTHNLACLGTERMWAGDLKGGRQAYWQSLRINPLRLKSALRLAASWLPQGAFRNLR